MSTAAAVVGGALACCGALLTLLGALGVLRLPDVLLRLNASSKAASLGVACVLAGVVTLQPSWGAAVKAVAAVLLQFMTAAVSAHVIGRAAHASGVRLWAGTTVDELAAARPVREGRPAKPAPRPPRRLIRSGYRALKEKRDRRGKRSRGGAVERLVRDGTRPGRTGPQPPREDTAQARDRYDGPTPPFDR